MTVVAFDQFEAFELNLIYTPKKVMDFKMELVRVYLWKWDSLFGDVLCKFDSRF